MELSKKAIKEIAAHLDMGMICFVHKETKEVKSIVDPNDIYAEEEHWKEDLEEIEKESDKYLQIEKMPSREAFQIMADFTGLVENTKIRNRLIYALNQNKPFRKFKYEVDYNEHIRQQWFKYKSYRYEEWVKTYIEVMTKEPEEEELPIISGFFNDDGTPYNPDLHPIPNLCLTCKKKDDPNEEMICNLTRMDQQGEKEFKCFAYEKKEKKHV